MTAINVDIDNTVYTSVNGILFTCDMSKLIKYPVGKTETEYVIPSSVETIDSYAFSNCTSLTSITIPDSVTSIGRNAFQYCTSLTSITIPNTVTSISNYAFSVCTSLTSITIPDSVTSVGGYAFNLCSSLTDIYFEGSLPMISSYAFGNTVVARAYYPYEDETWTDVENSDYGGTLLWVGLDADGNPVEKFYASGTSDDLSLELTNLGTLTISCSGDMTDYSSSKKIPWYSVRTAVTSVIIENGVTSIGNYAFSGCTSLTSITIPDSVTSIGNYAFYGCSSLTSIEIPSSVTSIGTHAFSECISLTSITIPDIVTSISSYAFSGCTSLTSITMPSGVTSIGYSVFSDCTSLTSIAIPDSVTSIDLYAFRGCTSLSSIEIPDSVTSIGSYAFSGCTSLTNVTIPNSVTSIGSSAFYGCSSLTSITIPGSVTSIGNNAFAGCTSLITINVDAENTSYTSVDGVLFNYAMTELIQYPAGKADSDYDIPVGVTSIGSQAFYGCSSLTNIEIPSSVTSIGGGAFSGCTSLTSITIPNGVTDIWMYAFSGCTSLTSITIPNGVTDIHYYAFSGCTSLTNVEIPDTVTSIGNHAFYGCTSLTSITIPNSVTSIDNYTFYNCRSLTSITIPDSVTSIGKYAFYGCSSLTSIEIPDSVTSIGDRAFYDCRSLTSITIPDSVTSIGNFVFYSCIRLTDVAIPNSVTSIGTNAFSECISLTNITIPDSVTEIDTSAFSYCIGLTDIWFEGSAPTISDDAFDDVAARAYYPCEDESWTDDMKSDYGGTLVWIGLDENGNPVEDVYMTGTCGDDLIWKYTNLGNLYISGTGNMESWDCGSESPWHDLIDFIVPLQSITIENGVTSIGNYAFDSCSNVSSITIPASIEEIGSYAFYNCTGLEEIYFDGSAPNIEEYAFTGVTAKTYYNPVDNEWSPEDLQNYGGEITWIAIDENGNPIVTYVMYLYSEGELYFDRIVAEGSTIEISSLIEPVRDGYTFNGWVDTDGNAVTEDITVSGDINLYACWSDSAYTLYLYDGDVLVESWSVDADSVLTIDTLPELTQDGYTFNGWVDADGNAVTEDITVSGDITLYANWTPNTYTLYLYNGENLISVQTFDFGETIAVDTLPELTQDGYTFNGWVDADGNAVTEDITVSGDITLYANWSLIATTYPEIIYGEEQTWSSDSSEDLTITSDADYSDFLSVSVDGEEISSDNYTVESGSTIVTLKAAYLATLSVGEHTFSINSITGSATTTFTIAASNSDEDGSDTGDTDTENGGDGESGDAGNTDTENGGGGGTGTDKNNVDNTDTDTDASDTDGAVSDTGDTSDTDTSDTDNGDDAEDDAADSTDDDSSTGNGAEDTTGNVSPFTDDDSTGTWLWASDYIYECYAVGILTGYEDGSYLPDSSLTRAEAAAIIARAYGLTSDAEESTFSDVSSTHWGLHYIEACVEAGIINGYEDGTFKPEQYVTRVELAKMIAVAEQLSLDAAESSFSDVSADHWGLQYIEACVEAGIVNGYTDGTFLPANNVTRAEAATMIARALGLVE